MNGFQKIILATVIFSINPVVLRLIELDAATTLWAVNLVAALCLGAMILTCRPAQATPLRGGIGTFLLLAVVFTVNNLLYIFAIKTTTLANSVFTHYLAPVILLFFSFSFFREKVTRSTLVALVMSLVGLLLILSQNEFSFSNRDFLGLTLGTGSALFFALEILYKKLLVEKYRPDFVVLVYVSISVVILLPFISISGLSSLGAKSALLLLLSGSIASALGITLFTSGLREVQANHAGIVGYLEPFGAVLWGAVILAELPGVVTWVGGGCILAGTLVLHFRNS
jgi:drug/metabolite transporter (DMT)-like permease